MSIGLPQVRLAIWGTTSKDTYRRNTSYLGYRNLEAYCPWTLYTEVLSMSMSIGLPQVRLAIWGTTSKDTYIVYLAETKVKNYVSMLIQPEIVAFLYNLHRWQKHIKT